MTVSRVENCVPGSSLVAGGVVVHRGCTSYDNSGWLARGHCDGGRILVKTEQSDV